MQCGNVMGHLDVQCLASTVEVCCSWVSISEALSAVRCFTSKTFYVAYIVEALSECVIHFAKLCQASCCAGTVFIERGEKPTQVRQETGGSDQGV